ncbi:MAG: HAMP domain-containing histidine kinase [Fimbriimonadaceae bacterium]|nr:HAMP domain-containing histidine kinase [Fimbriimonadaceae bacterium]
MATWFASPQRSSAAEVAAAEALVAANPLATALIDAMPELVLVVDDNRQVVAANRAAVRALGADGEPLLGRRPGELVGCLHATEMHAGCGTAKACQACGAVDAMLCCLLGVAPTAEREARIMTTGAADGGALDLAVKASNITLSGRRFVILALRDIASEKRRQVLERTFFHDLLNSAGGVFTISEVLLAEDEDPAFEHELKEDLHRLSEQVIDEIRSQRQLLAAESGDLRLDCEAFSSNDVLQEVAAAYRRHQVGHDREVVVDPPPALLLVTDRTVLRRVLGNLVKNALEATPMGGSVTVGARAEGDLVEFWVHNPGVMPEEVQVQIFARSFSTKPGAGRGVGTYSVRLLTERYLRGKVSFRSEVGRGTVFRVVLPVAIDEPLARR